jgi:hypothetical protein
LKRVKKYLVLERRCSIEVSVKRAMCFFCKSHCIQMVYVKDGRLVRVDPSPINDPLYTSRLRWLFRRR